MIAALFNIPTSPTQFSRFSFHNNDAHVLAARALRPRGFNIPEYLLDPIPGIDREAWLYTHQAAHNAVNDALGLTGNDLTSVDPEKLDQLTNWIQLHAAEHRRWGDLLNYG